MRSLSLLIVLSASFAQAAPHFELEAPPSLEQLPQEALRFDASLDLSPEAVSWTLGDGEPLQLKRQGRRLEGRSARFYYSLNPKRGQLLFQLREGAQRAVTSSSEPEQFAQRSLELLEELGIPRSEMAPPKHHKLMRARMEKGSVHKSLHSHKVYIQRLIQGVPVQGDRLIFSYHPDGQLRKVLGRWSRLSPKGHQLRSKLNIKEIESRLQERLSARGHQGGLMATPRYLYLSELQEDGSVRLSLRLQVLFRPDDNKTRVELLPLD